MDDTQSLMEQAVAAARRKDFASARSLLRQLLRQDPNHLNAWLLAAHVVEKRSDTISCYKQVLRLDPGHAYARQKLSQLESEPPASVPAPPSQARPVSVRDDPNIPAKPAVPPRVEASQPPIVNRPQIGPSSRPKTSDVNSGLKLLLGVLIGLFCLVVGGVIFLLSGGQLLKPGAPTPTSEQLFNVIYENARAANQKDAAAYMATIHPKSPLYRQTEITLPQIFAVYDLESYFYDLELVSLKANEAKVHFSLLTRRLNGPAFRDNIVIGTMILRPDQGVWKIYNQTVEDVQY